MSLTSILTAAINQIDQHKPVNREVYSNPAVNVENEFLLILKPELLTDFIKPHFEDILHFMVEKFNEYGIHVSNARIINAKYLDTYDVMAKHYGVINAAARNFKVMISPEVSSTFKQIYGLEITEAPVAGSLELLKQGTMDSSTLNALWKDCEIQRLAGGIYSGKVRFNGNDLYIVNGFHPPQLDHFIAEGRMIVTMNIAGNLSWEKARNELIGNTYPEKASPESIRGSLFQKYGKFGFDHVSYVLNSVHLSAGPLEGLLELQRFNSTIENEAGIDAFVFGKMLQKEFSTEQLHTILANPTVEYKGQSISLFDLTELKNSEEAVRLISQTIQ